MFFKWIKEEEHKRVFEKSTTLRVLKEYLRGAWDVIRKIRLVRFIRRLIEEGIIVPGVADIYGEGRQLLSEMEKAGTGGGEQEDGNLIQFRDELRHLKAQGQSASITFEIKSLDALCVTYSSDDGLLTREGNAIVHRGDESSSCRQCFIGGKISTV